MPSLTIKHPLLFLSLTLVLALCACNPAAEHGQPLVTPSVTRNAQPTALPDTPTPAVTPTSNPALQDAAGALSGLQISFWHPWSGALAQELESITREFNSSNAWGIQVVTTPYGGAQGLNDAVEKGATRSVAGDGVANVIIAASSQLLLWDAQHSLFTDLNPYLQDSLWGLTAAEQADIPQVYWEQDVSGGKRVGLPGLRNMAVLFYNQSWADALGYSSPPASFSDFSAQACAAGAERKDIDETGGWIISTSPLSTYSWLVSAGADNIYDVQNQAFQFDTPEALSVLSDLKDLSADGCIWPARLPDPYDYFASRQALLYSGTLTDIPLQSAAMRKNNSTDEWLILPYPSGGEPHAVVEGSSYAVTESTPEEQLAAWLFLRWLILPRNQAALGSAGGYLPASESAYAEMEDFQSQYPQWAAAREWAPAAVSVPTGGSWAVVQNLLEDAAWQTFQTFTPPEVIPVLLEQLDGMIPEVLSETYLPSPLP
jgi:multiple sugar transport system substrate-binding protein